MKALLLVSHGSRRKASNDEVRALTEAVRAQVCEEYEIVEAAFLELSEPLIPDGIDLCVARGATEVVVFPYFLAAGRHVADDIPGIAFEAITRHPGVTLRIAPHLGGSAMMSRFVADNALSVSNLRAQS